MPSTGKISAQTDIRAILFDLDGTIVNLMIDWQLVRNELKLHYENILKLTIPAKLGMASMIELAESGGRSHARALAAEILTKYEGEATYSTIRNVVSLIQVIPDSKMLALVTNNLHSTGERILGELALAHRFSSIVGFDDVCRSKPAPDGIVKALGKLRVPPHEAILIGDSDSDRKAAYAADTHFCCIRELMRCQRDMGNHGHVMQALLRGE